MTDISSLLPPPPPMPSFSNRIKIKLEYTDLKAQFYQVANLKESLLVDLNEKKLKQVKLRMECDLILDQIELIRSRLPIGLQNNQMEDSEMKRFRKYQDKIEGFMYESDDELINKQKERDEMNEEEDGEDEEEDENEEEDEQEQEQEYEGEEGVGDVEMDGEGEEEEQGHDQYHQQRILEQHNFSNQSRSLPPPHHQQILHQQQQQQPHHEEDEEQELEDDEEEEDEDVDEYEDGDDQSTHQSYPHLDQTAASVNYPNKNIS